MTGRSIATLWPDGPSFRYIFLLAVCATLGTGTSALAQVDDINYSISAIGQSATFNGDARLDDGHLFGGEIGIRFGDLVELGGGYFYSNPVFTDFSQLQYGSASDFRRDWESVSHTMEDRQIRLRRFGGRVRVNAWRGLIAPFVTAGTGVLQFDLEDGLAGKNFIYLSAGIGVRLSLSDRISLSVAAENFAYQYDPETTLLSDRDLVVWEPSRRHYARKNAHMRSLTAALHLSLGGRTDYRMAYVDRELRSEYQGGRFRLTVEPFYGQINFNESLGFPDSRAVVGITAGFDLGPFVGLRGFYWRNTEQDQVFDGGVPNDLDEVAYYGGEVHLRFNSRYGGRNLVPSVIMGGGYMSVDGRASFYGQYWNLLASRYFAVGGIGLELPLGASIMLQGSLRSLMMGAVAGEGWREPGSIAASMMYTFGFKFNFGGSGGTSRGALERQLAAERAEAQARADELSEELSRLQARLDRITDSRTAAEDVSDDSLGLPQQILIVPHDSGYVALQRTSNLSGQTITIPVPEVGEIYVRFGDLPAAPSGMPYSPPIVVTMPDGEMPIEVFTPAPAAPGAAQRDTVIAAGGLTAEQIREIVRQVVSDETEQAGPTGAELNESLRRMEGRIERHVAREIDRLRDEQRVAIAEEEPPAVTESPRRRRWIAGLGRPTLEELRPYLGLHAGDGGAGVLLGVRGEYRFADRDMRLLPEIGLGIGPHFVTGSLLASVAWDLRRIGPMEPYAGIGAGLYGNSRSGALRLVLNLLVGAEFEIWGNSNFFSEYSTLNFLYVNRLVVGYRLRL